MGVTINLWKDRRFASSIYCCILWVCGVGKRVTMVWCFICSFSEGIRPVGRFLLLGWDMGLGNTRPMGQVHCEFLLAWKADRCGHGAIYCFIINRSIVQVELNLALDLSLMIGNPKVCLHLDLVAQCFLWGVISTLWTGPFVGWGKSWGWTPHSYHSIFGSRSFPRQVGVAEKALPVWPR